MKDENKKKPVRKDPAKKKNAAKKATGKKPAQKKDNPDGKLEAIEETLQPEVAEETAQPEDSRISTYEKIKEERARKRRRMMIVGLTLFVLVAGSLLTYLALRPKPEITSSKTSAATATASKPAFKGVQPGRIYISRLGIDEQLYLSETGTITDEDLLKGANFYNEETSKAGFGNCVIFGHSAVTSAHGAPFGAIGDGLAKEGDKIVLTDANNNQFTYIVDKIYEISATDFSVVQPIGEGETPVLTLITCIAPGYPKDKRLVVHAVLQK